MILVPPSDAQTRRDTIVDALVSVLLTRDPGLMQNSMSGLRSLAPQAIPRMIAAIEDNSLSPEDCVFLQDAIEEIRHSTQVRKPTESLLDALLGGLRIGDEALQQLASRAIACCGPESVDYLIQAAAENIRHPDYCLRLLSAAEEGGHQPGSETRVELMLDFIGTKNTAVRDRAMALFFSFAPHALSCRGNES